MVERSCGIAETPVRLWVGPPLEPNYNIGMSKKRDKQKRASNPGNRAERAYLHNSVTIDIRDASVSQLKASIEWYERVTEEWKEWKAAEGHKVSYWPTIDYSKQIAACKAELANRIGK